MCLPIDSCFGFGAPRTDDDHYHHAPASRTQLHGERNSAHHNGNSNGVRYNGNGNSYPVHKASNDANVVPAGGWHGHAPATGAQEKMPVVYPYAGADGTLKHQQPAAPNGRVPAADGARSVAQRNYYYEPAHKEDGADSYYATATAYRESPSEALGKE